MRRGAGIYLVTRIHGLRTHLITTHNLQIIAKTKDLRDVSDSLMKTEYANELSQIPTQEQDAASLENIFLTKLVQRFLFVRAAAQGKMQELLDRYNARFEVENIKRVLRAKHGSGPGEPTLIPLPRGSSLVNFPALLKAKDVEEVISLLRETPYHILGNVQSYSETGEIVILEATLDATYFTRIWEKVGKVKGILDLVGEEIDLRNLLIAFYMKTRELPARTIEQAIIPISHSLPKVTLHSLLQSRLEDWPNILSAVYSTLALDVVNSVKSRSSLPMEQIFSNRLYEDANTVLRTRPLQSGYIIAYLLLCECEARNLISIVTGKQLKLSQEMILKGLLGI